MTVSSLPATQAPDALLLEIFELKHSTWPKFHTPEAYAAGQQEFLERTRRQGAIHFWIKQQQVLMAHARYFPRELHLAHRATTVGCLAAVCVLPEMRGQHLGRQLMEAVFAEVERGKVDLFLLQTAVPNFYTTLGAKAVTNQFYNGQDASQREVRPWWEPHVMVYPASFPWPEDPVNIEGPGF